MISNILSCLFYFFCGLVFPSFSNLVSSGQYDEIILTLTTDVALLCIYSILSQGTSWKHGGLLSSTQVQAGNAKSGFIIDSSNPEIEDCVSNNNNENGFLIENDSTGKYNGCTAEGNTNSGFCIDSSNPEMESCNSINHPGFYKTELGGRKYKVGGNGFYINNKSTGKYFACKASNNSSGIFVFDSNPLMENCTSNNNENGFWIKNNSTGKYIGCKAEENSTKGFFVEGASPELKECQASNNGESGFHISKQINRIYIGFKDSVMKSISEGLYIVATTANDFLKKEYGQYTFCKESSDSNGVSTYSAITGEIESNATIINCSSLDNKAHGYFVADNTGCTFTECNGTVVKDNPTKNNINTQTAKGIENTKETAKYIENTKEKENSKKRSPKQERKIQVKGKVFNSNSFPLVIMVTTCYIYYFAVSALYMVDILPKRFYPLLVFLGLLVYCILLRKAKAPTTKLEKSIISIYSIPILVSAPISYFVLAVSNHNSILISLFRSIVALPSALVGTWFSVDGIGLCFAIYYVFCAILGAINYCFYYSAYFDKYLRYHLSVYVDIDKVRIITIIIWVYNIVLSIAFLIAK